jgi:hypothetical protein
MNAESNRIEYKAVSDDKKDNVGTDTGGLIKWIRKM